MKKIKVVGGGPAGLFFSILMCESFPNTEIEIFERKAPNNIEGWGIVLNLATINLLQKNDTSSYNRIVDFLQHWSDVDTYHNNEFISVRGKQYASISRKIFINTLRLRCEELGIPIHYETKINNAEELGVYDLLVGADGAYSTIRNQFAGHFQSSIEISPDYFIWLGTKRIFPTITHIFKQTDHGILSAEAYSYSPDHSTFIVICNKETWQKCDFASMNNQETQEYLAQAFETELAGHGLDMNEASQWRNFPLVKNANWYRPGVLLLGDALHTAHFSIGSGTRLAIEDAIMAAESFRRCSVMECALQDFEARRRQFIDRYQKAARDSLSWFENIEKIIHLDLIPFAFETMTRSGKLGIRSLQLQDPEFVEKYRQSQRDNTSS